MSAKKRYLAFDLGAESGRAVIGHYDAGQLRLEGIHRFANEPVEYNGELHWDVPRLWLSIRETLNIARRFPRLDGIGIDGWGLDYALLGRGGKLLENPYHYRDKRNDSAMDRVFALIPPEELYARTGTQLMKVNTLYQLYAGFLSNPEFFDVVETMVMIPDLFSFWLTGEIKSEYTAATTTQFYDVRNRRWATEIFEQLGLPVRILPEVVQPGTVLGPVRREVVRETGIGETQVIAPASHDTASAVVATYSAGESAFISSGTWSLLGCETMAPITDQKARTLNFTNEGGVSGTIRLLKNITGMWILQGCRRQWEAMGHDFAYAELLSRAGTEPAFRSLIDPDHPSFHRSTHMLESIASFCRDTEQPVPGSPGAFVRTILESLALKYRFVLDSLEEITNRTFSAIHVVGGGSQNELLNQFTAEATARPVLAGPAEATALGNIGVQMIAGGEVSSLQEVRETIANSFPARVFEPREAEKWEQCMPRFSGYCKWTEERNRAGA